MLLHHGFLDLKFLLRCVSIGLSTFEKYIKIAVYTLKILSFHSLTLEQKRR